LHPFHFTGAKILIRFAQYAVSANVPVVFCWTLHLCCSKSYIPTLKLKASVTLVQTVGCNDEDIGLFQNTNSYLWMIWKLLIISPTLMCHADVTISAYFIGLVYNTEYWKDCKSLQCTRKRKD
jgi:hypothetical protein